MMNDLNHCKDCENPKACGTARPCDAKRIAELESAIRWALGEEGEFPVISGPPRYRWRTELRKRSRISTPPEQDSADD